MMQHQQGVMATGAISTTTAPRLLVPKAGGLNPVLDEPFLAQSPNVAAAMDNYRAGPFQQQQQQQQQQLPHPTLLPTHDLEPIGSLSLPSDLAAPAYLMPSNPNTPTGSPYSSPRRNTEPRGGNGSFGHSNLRPPSKLGPGASSLQSRLDG